MLQLPIWLSPVVQLAKSEGHNGGWQLTLEIMVEQVCLWETVVEGHVLSMQKDSSPIFNTSLKVSEINGVRYGVFGQAPIES